MNRETITKIDNSIIAFLQKISGPLSRFAIFLVFFWFGALKLFGTSPANPLVSGLLEKTLPFITFNQFIFMFGVYEIIIGILFLFPSLIRIAIPLLFIHMITTVLPLFLLTPVTWQGFLTPTLEGQYIIKNIVIIALALSLASNVKPLERVVNNE
jgi:uncharacterized membrane protein YkgB